jgi:hypothetical protein
MSGILHRVSYARHMPDICQTYVTGSRKSGICLAYAMNITFLGNPDGGKRGGFIPVVHHVIWILVTPISSVGPSISNVTFDIEDSDIVCLFDIDVLHLRIALISYIDIKGVRYRRSDHQPSISNVITGSLISRFHDCDIEGNKLGYHMLILYTASKAKLTFDTDIEGHVIHIGFDMGYRRYSTDKGYGEMDHDAKKRDKIQGMNNSLKSIKK